MSVEDPGHLDTRVDEACKPLSQCVVQTPALGRNGASAVLDIGGEFSCFQETPPKMEYSYRGKHTLVNACVYHICVEYLHSRKGRVKCGEFEHCF